MKRRVSLLPVMIGVSFVFHGAALLLLPGLRGGTAPLPKAAESPIFSLVNIELPAAAVPPPPAPAAGYPAADETPPVEEGAVPNEGPAEAPVLDAASVVVPAAVSAAAPAVVPAVSAAAPAASAAARGAGQNTARRGAAVSAGERKALAAAYTRRNFDYIGRRIREKLVYPPQARRTGVQGRAEAIFTVYPDGSVGGLEILASSGQESLDQALVDAIRAAAPFPPPPVEIRLAMPLTFRLK